MYVSFCETWCRYAKLHGVISGKIGTFIATAVRSQKLAFFLCQGLIPMNHSEKV
jgi:hypothetical protein